MNEGWLDDWMDAWMERLRDLIKPYRKGTAPIEIRRAVIEEVGSRVVAAGEGKRVFPFNRVRVHLLAAGTRERDELAAIVREAWDLEGDVKSRLTELGARVPPDLGVEVEVTDQPSAAFGDRRYHLELSRDEAPAAADEAPRPILELTVLKGSATQRVYSFEGPERVTIGRLEEVVDEAGRVRRRNDVAFLDDGEINATVSREQARIVWDDDLKAFRLRAEPGASATRILRDGRTLEVSPQDRRGVRLQAGDEVYLGKASVKVAVRSG